MRRQWIASVVLVAALIGTGCAKDKMDDKSMSKMDACPMCPGIQKATADGKCPDCHMPVKSAMMERSSADVCTHCPGVQSATADGKCPMCGAKAAM